MTDRELLDKSLAELQMQLEKHQQFVHRAFDGRGSGENCCLWTGCRHRRLLRTILFDAIRVLEDTRRAFKSKQLESLRKGLMQVLAEETDGEEATSSVPSSAVRQRPLATDRGLTRR